MILNFKGLALGLTVAAGIAMPAMAQNVGNNAGIWWTPAAGQPSAFTFLNPLTTMYFRIGFLRAFQGNSGQSHTTIGILPTDFPGQSLDAADAWGGSLGMGARLMPVLRYELQLSGSFNSDTIIRRVDFPGEWIRFRASSVQLMNNLYLDVAPFFGNGLWGLNPYLMGGIGVSWNSTGDQVFAAAVSGGGTGQTRTNFAWNAGVGVQWQAMRNLIVDVAYRYLDAGRFQNGFTNPGTPFTTRYDNTSHQIMVGVVVPFAGLIRGFGN